MATSTVPAVMAALLPIFRARPGLTGVQIEYARPSDDVMALDSIWYVGSRMKQKVEAIGNTRRDETYTIDLMVSVRYDGDDAQVCAERMWALVAEIELAVRENPKPIPAPLFDVQFAGADPHVLHGSPGQRFSDVLVAIDARSRI